MRITSQPKPSDTSGMSGTHTYTFGNVRLVTLLRRLDQWCKVHFKRSPFRFIYILSICGASDTSTHYHQSRVEIVSFLGLQIVSVVCEKYQPNA